MHRAGGGGSVAGMKLILGMLIAVLAAGRLAAVESSHVADPSNLATPADVAGLESRLAKFEQDTGIRVVIEFHPKSPPEAEDRQPGAYMRALSTKLGLIDDGVLAVFFADDPDWRVWIGNDLAAKFAGQPGTAAELTKSGAMHAAKEVWLKTVFARSDTAWKKRVGEAPDEVRPAEKVVMEAGSIIVGLENIFGQPAEK